MNYSYVAIEGLIGAGKTTLAHRLASDLNARTILEEFEENPFLPMFYKNPARHAFTVELSFLAQRYHQLKAANDRDLFQPLTIADYSLGKSLVFAQATLQADELKLFRDLYDIMYGELAGPELIIYLQLSQERVKEQIAMRGRSYERDISDRYLNRLQELYLDHLSKLKNTRVVLLEVGSEDLQAQRPRYNQVLELLQTKHPVGISRVPLNAL